jgi:hypothetical protein
MNRNVLSTTTYLKKQNYNASELDHTEAILSMVSISNKNSPKILQPSKQVFGFPSTPISPKLSAILSRRLFASLSVWRDHFKAAFVQKLLVKTVAIIGLIANKLVRRIPGKTTGDSCPNKLYFMGRSAFKMSGDRKARSVCDDQDLGAFAALCFADSKIAFFAGGKQPSMKASRISITVNGTLYLK